MRISKAEIKMETLKLRMYSGEICQTFPPGGVDLVCGMSVLRWAIPPVFLFYLGCELILTYTRKFYQPSVSSVAVGTPGISQQVSQSP